MKIPYKDKIFRRASEALIAKCNQIIAEFSAQGFELTLRQLYYQLVSRDVIPNNERSYDNLGALVSDARLAGLIDWDAIIDRTRNLRALSHWDTPSDIIAGAASQFRYDLWEDQPRRVEVWIEKDALVGVIQQICQQYDVPYFSCRGYTSQSEMWGAAQRIVHRYERASQETTIIHLGDHDPSGKDMSRDIEDRLNMFCGYHGTPEPILNRIALNMDQIEQYNPPPNPAKTTDCRAAKYIAEFGNESWELDALSPATIVDLIRTEIEANIDDELFQAQRQRQTEARAELQLISDNYPAVVRMLAKRKGKKNGKKNSVEESDN